MKHAVVQITIHDTDDQLIPEMSGVWAVLCTGKRSSMLDDEVTRVTRFVDCPKCIAWLREFRFGTEPIKDVKDGSNKEHPSKKNP